MEAAALDAAGGAPILRADVDARQLAAELNRDGFVCIENGVSPEWLQQARAWVQGLVAENGERYFSLNWAARKAGTPAAALTSDPGVRKLLDDLVRLGCPRAEADDEIYTVLRVIAGGEPVSEKHTLIYHYDNVVITMLAPIFIPTSAPRQSGELIAFPNKRGYRWSALANIVEKAIVQSNWYQRRQTRKLPSGEIGEIRHLVPGNLYLFWGYRTYHANFSVAPGNLRATLLLHHGDPHGGSWALKFFKYLNVRRERRNLQAGKAA